ncbi:MAG: CRTAC1 family protein [Candidatus Scalindua sp.]|nr:CRTAC1 family protein [Candidatus Scalindua sp.]MBT6051184.1 CRTAC1 family protein [Candidatus Scalindua sp.]MBT7591933.1 CRTAC1 family protein [Candidatus Scalindua sp.]
MIVFISSCKSCKKAASNSGGQEIISLAKINRESTPVGLYLKERSILDEKYWKQEVLAQTYEAPIIAMWDQLRISVEKLEIFKKFLPDSWIPPTNPEITTINSLIESHEYEAGYVPHSHDQQLDFIEKLRKQKFKIIQSEWHHLNFQKAGPTYLSTVSFEIHAVNPDNRFIIKGLLEIRWNKDKRDHADQVKCQKLTVLRKKGGSVFAKIKIPPIPESHQKLPPRIRKEVSTHNSWLLLYDLNKDGLSEIILPQENTVYWNQGNLKFIPKPLSEYSWKIVSCAIIADINADGNPDLIFAGSNSLEQDQWGYWMMEKQSLVILKGNSQGEFNQPGEFIMTGLMSSSVITAGDIDKDGDLDLWIGQYLGAYKSGQMPTPYYDANDGYPSYFLINENHGKSFRDATESSGLLNKRFRRTYSASFVDLDEDGHLDLLKVNDFAGFDLFYNNGKGVFRNVTQEKVNKSSLFGMAHSFGDFNKDGHLDFYVTGMSSTTARRLDKMGCQRPDFAEYDRKRMDMAYGNRMYLWDSKGIFKQPEFRDQVARTGWSWGCSSLDFDNDGNQDIYVANGHNSRKTAQDYCTHFWRDDIYRGNSKPDPELSTIYRAVFNMNEKHGHSWNGFEHNHLLVNQGEKGFINLSFLMGIALEEDCRAVVSDDLDGDGKVDLLVTEPNKPGHRGQLFVLKNNFPNKSSWIGVQLEDEKLIHKKEIIKGGSPIGTKVKLKIQGQEQIAVFVNGDSFTCQHSLTKHFGLGQNKKVDSLEVLFPNGTKKVIKNPKTNQYHKVLQLIN